MRIIQAVVMSAMIFSSTLGFMLAKQPSLQDAGSIRLNTIVPSANSKMILLASREPEDLEETTRKYGLEAGLYKAVTAKPEDGQKVKPQDLLKKYGAAYLATSITLAIISYGLCYLLVSTGVDVSKLLEKVGIQSTTAAANTGTAAIAYAVHKAASPIRFPPTVMLTPVVAGWFGKKNVEEEMQ